MQHRPRTDERAMTGIGVLILFIALVLVSAIASGVILDTTGLLQNQAQQTGEESTQQTSNRINIITVHGTLAANDTVENVSITVSPAPGAGPINLSEITLKAMTPRGAIEGGWSVRKNNFSINSKFDTDGSIQENGVLNDDSDRAAIAWTAEGSGAYLREGEKITILIALPDGGKVVYIANVPESLEKEQRPVVLL